MHFQFKVGIKKKKQHHDKKIKAFYSLYAETSKAHTVYNRLETTSCTLWLFSHQLGLVTLRTITIYTLSIEQILKHGYPFRKLNSTGVCKEDGWSMNLVKAISVLDPSLCFKWMEKDWFSLLKFKVKNKTFDISYVMKHPNLFWVFNRKDQRLCFPSL